MRSMLQFEVARLFVEHEEIFRQLGVTREMLERSTAGASAPEFGSEGWRALARAETREEVSAADLYIRQEGLFRQLGVTPDMLAKAKQVVRPTAR